MGIPDPYPTHGYPDPKSPEMLNTMKSKRRANVSQWKGKGNEVIFFNF